EHRTVPAPLGDALAEHQRVIAEAEQILESRRARLASRKRIESALPCRIFRQVDRRQRRHQTQPTQSGCMSSGSSAMPGAEKRFLKVKAWLVGPKRSMCHRRESPSLIVGIDPAGTHHKAWYAPSNRSKNSRR